MKFQILLISIFAILFSIVAGCDSGNTPDGCTTPQDCTGSPGEGCSWLCADGQCQARCPEECQGDADCTDKQWTEECTGHWECIETKCQAICDPECTLPVDCDGLTWPLQCDGHWDCDNGQCQAVCDTECTLAVDCDGQSWTELCVGHWECPAGVCIQVCDADCSGPDDCLEWAWTEPCTGHWECPGGVCLQVCDEYPCQGQGDCQNLPWDLQCVGHWECSGDHVCVPICDQACVSELDCLGLPWPLENCPGHWECNSNDFCEAICDTEPDCIEPIDCLGHLWDIYCMGHWICDGGFCFPECQGDCGDGFCDEMDGEGPATCAIDCEPECVGAGLPLYDENSEFCCPELTPADDCYGQSPAGDICTSTIFCLACGDQECGPHENPYNCLDDCLEGCQVGQQESFFCGEDGIVIPWCMCTPSICRPVCFQTAPEIPGWHDPCTDAWLAPGNCATDEAECRLVGTDSEGWYGISQNGEQYLISYAECAPTWECIEDPASQCPITNVDP